MCKRLKVSDIRTSELHLTIGIKEINTQPTRIVHLVNKTALDYKPSS